MPDAARKPIENELDLYRRFADATAAPPSETRKNLERAAELASKLLEVIEDFGPEEHRALAACSEQGVALSGPSYRDWEFIEARRRSGSSDARIGAPIAAEDYRDCISGRVVEMHQLFRSGAFVDR